MKSENTRWLLPDSVIRAAAAGDAIAVTRVLRHYERYIYKAATRTFFDEYGNTYRCVDEELRQRIQTKLISRIVVFEPREDTHTK